VTIALATAMQESKLRNLDYGDRDSLGLFQQRPSQGWGTPEQIMDPVYAAGKFYSELVKVTGFEDMPITEAAQAVQRSAYPDAYAKHEAAARSFASSLTGHSPAALTCSLSPATSPGQGDRFVASLRAEWGDSVADAAHIDIAEASSAVGSVAGSVARSVTRPDAGSAAGSGTGADAGSGGTAGTVTLTAATPTEAWALAAWSVAKSSELNTASVQVDGQLWQRGTGTWSAEPDSASPAGAPAGGTGGRTTTVVVTLAA
jgi:hypothetical protein